MKNIRQTLSIAVGQPVSPLDFTDDRLGIVLKYLSTPSVISFAKNFREEFQHYIEHKKSMV